MPTIYDDGRYIITESAFSTPTRLYPLTHATARIRRDLVWFAVAASGLSGASIAVYADLLAMTEVACLAALPVIVTTIAANMGILAIDAPGHQRSLILARPKKVRALFNALRRAKLAEISAPLRGNEDQDQLETSFVK